MTKDRLLSIYTRLLQGNLLNRKAEAQRFGCSVRSIQRDIDDLRSFLHDQNENAEINQDIIYDKKLQGYKLISASKNTLTAEEGFAVLKILLESRALTKEELYPILDKIGAACTTLASQTKAAALIGNERLHYVEPKHGKLILRDIWRLAEAVREQREVLLSYHRTLDDKIVQRVLQPVGIMFSEFYFYLMGFIVKQKDEKINYSVDNDPYPTIYRIDRIQNFTVTDKHFKVPYADRFEEGEFRKRVQFMYGGRLRRIKLYYKGPSVEAVLDRLPTAEITRHDKQGWLIKAEVFGNGIDMWLRSQGGNVELVSDEVEGGKENVR